MTAPEADRTRQLLAEGTALRSLARSLLGGHADADDLVQETLVASLRSPRADAAQRPWLAGTLRNLALLWRRTSTRRAAREAVAAAAALPGDGDPAAIAAQAEAMRVVAAAVHELEEPFRTVIVLRFWRGLLPEAIAQHLDVPRNTVRSRLQRGLERLRTRLDQNFGDRREWLAALAPFASPGEHATATALATQGAAAASTTFGALLMTKLHIALVTAAIVAVGILVWSLDRSVAAPRPTTPSDRSEVAGAPGASTNGTTATPAATEAGAVATDRRAAEPELGLLVLGSVTRAGAPCPDFPLGVQWFDGVETTGKPTVEHTVRSDATGQFVWRGPVRTTTGMLRAVPMGSAGDHWVSCTPVIVLAGQTEAELSVTVRALDHTLFGRVHDVGGAPIAGAELIVRGAREVATSSDADGRYELRVPGPPFPLMVHKTGYRERDLDAVVAGEQRHELDIELLPGAVFAGRVVDEAGNPIAGAAVNSMSLAFGTETDAAGKFAFGGAAPGEEHGLTVTRAGFQPAMVGASAGGAPVEIVLRPGLAMTVRVVGDRGEALAGARVGVQSVSFLPMVNRGYTDAEGRLLISDLPANTIRVKADKPGFVSAHMEPDLRDLRGELLLVLRTSRTIGGRVLDSKGQPVVGAFVRGQLRTADGQLQAVGREARSDTAGGFILGELPPEPCIVMAERDGRRSSLPDVTGTPTDLVVRLEPAASVAGRVVDGITGAPVAAFTIALVADHEVHPLQHVEPVRFTNADGSFRITHWQLQPGGSLFVDVSAAGYAPQRIPGVALVDAPRDQHVIRLHAGTTVRGVVRDAVSGAPVPATEVVLQSGDGPDTTVAFTDAEGRFELRCVPPGENRVVLTHRDYPKRVFGPFEVQAGVPVLEVQPTLAPGATLRGRVTGVPQVAGMKLVVRAFGDTAIESVLGADGSFEVRGVPAGWVELTLTPMKGTWHSMLLEIGDDDVSGIEFAVPPPGTGSIRATVAGLPRGRGAVSRLGVAKGQCTTTRTFEYADATFVVDALPPGRYEVDVFSPGGSGSIEVDVATGEVAVTIEVVRK